MAQDKTKKKADDAKADDVKVKEPENQTPEKAPEQEPVTFKSTRYPQGVVQVKGRTLRESITFVDGEYTTDDPEEIDVLDGKDYAVRTDEK